MKKSIKILISVLLIMLCFIVGDSIYSYINKTVPFIHFKDKSTNVDRGIFFDVYNCNEENKIVGKFSKYECQKEEIIEEKVTTTKPVSARRKAFSEEILNKFIEHGNVDKSNLKSFNIIEISNIGYYASKPEEIYYQVLFNYECNDNTKSCVSLKIGEDDIYFNESVNCYSLWLIAKNDKVLKFMHGISININSDFVQEAELIE